MPEYNFILKFKNKRKSVIIEEDNLRNSILQFRILREVEKLRGRIIKVRSIIT